MVMVTIDIPQELNKQIEHFKVEHELKDKREAINLLLRQCVLAALDKPYTDNRRPFEQLYRLADAKKPHKLSPKDIESMDSDIYG